VFKEWNIIVEFELYDQSFELGKLEGPILNHVKSIVGVSTHTGIPGQIVETHNTFLQLDYAGVLLLLSISKYFQLVILFVMKFVLLVIFWNTTQSHTHTSKQLILCKIITYNIFIILHSVPL